jgi:hypothetical protein
VSERLSGNAAEARVDAESLRRIINSYQNLLSSVRGKLDEEDQRKIDVLLASSESLSPLTPIASPSNASRCAELLEPFRRSSISAHRYLGEISDVSFFNSVKGLLQNDPSSRHRCGAPLESYEREAAELSNAAECSPVGSL